MKYDLEDRLTNFAALVIDLIELLPNNKAASHLSGQLLRSGTSPALLYGEAQSAESRKDFVHKMKIGLKELRETMICLKIIELKKYLQGKVELQKALSEGNELISIFVTSIKTAKRNDAASN